MRKHSDCKNKDRAIYFKASKLAIAIGNKLSLNLCLACVASVGRGGRAGETSERFFSALARSTTPLPPPRTPATQANLCLALLPSIFMTGVHPPSPHPKSPKWQRTEVSFESRRRVTSWLAANLFKYKKYATMNCNFFSGWLTYIRTIWVLH